MPLFNLPRRNTFMMCLLTIMMGILPFFTLSFAQNSSPNDFLVLLENARKLTSEKKWTEAVPAWVQVNKENPVNGEYASLLGNAYYNTKQYAMAIEAYKKQMELGYGDADIPAYNIACCYALIGNKSAALEWLEKSFALGFKSYRHAQTDSDLISLHDDPKFNSITARADVSKMSRTEGWRFDLELLEREIRRKAYKSSPKLQFDTAINMIRTLEKNIAQLNDTEVVIELMKIMNKLGDGHSGIIPPFRMEDFKYTLPLQFYYFKEGLYIISADPKYKDLLGSQVLKYGGNTIDQVQKKVTPIISIDNVMGIPLRFPYLMRHVGGAYAMKLIPDKRKVDLEIKDPGGKTRMVTIAADTTQPDIWNVQPNPSTWVNLPQTLGSPLPLYLKNQNKKHWFEYLEKEKTVYCQINSITNDPKETLPKFTERLFQFIDSNNVDKLVIDLRWNNGGNTFLAMPLLHAVMRTQKINKRGNLFVIIGRRTYSAAQNTATFLERHTNAIFVGEPTGSSPNFVGEEDFLLLPYSKVLANVSDLYWQTSWPTDKRTWIAPLIYTPPTFRSYQTNRDEAMEAIINFKQPGKTF